MVFLWHGTMARYVTLRRVTVSWDAAVRFALREGLPLEKIRCAPDAELLHRTDWWAWWSDERLTGAIGIPEELRPVSLTPDAEELIDAVWCSFSTEPACSWQILAKVERVIERRILSCGKFYPMCSCFLECLEVKLLNGQVYTLYAHWVQDIEGGWSCNIMVERPGNCLSPASGHE